jgi:hydroxymethylpyrimidine/phosphomethylpyrimidine kinase
MKGRILIIAGSDSGGGAGIQADIKTVTALKGYAATAITAVTIQDTRKVHGVQAVPPAAVAAQIKVVLNDIGADAIKTGMLHDAKVISAVEKALGAKARRIPLIIDPVMAAKGGQRLLKPDAVRALKKLIKRAALVTPNTDEAAMFSGIKIKNERDMQKAAKKILKLGARAVLVKGGHLPGKNITDILYDGKIYTLWKSPRIKSRNTHGTGCTLASAIATFIAQGKSLKDSVALARKYVQGAIRHAPGLGKGHGPMNHGWKIGKVF